MCLFGVGCAVMCHLTMGIQSEKCVVRQFHHSVNTLSHTYTHPGGTADHTLRPYGTPPSSLGSGRSLKRHVSHGGIHQGTYVIVGVCVLWLVWGMGEGMGYACDIAECLRCWRWPCVLSFCGAHVSWRMSCHDLGYTCCD